MQNISLDYDLLFHVSESYIWCFFEKLWKNDPVINPDTSKNHSDTHKCYDDCQSKIAKFQ
jgi:hypothetical protein